MTRYITAFITIGAVATLVACGVTEISSQRQSENHVRQDGPFPSPTTLPQGAVVRFFSDWRTQSGNSADAILDVINGQRKWNEESAQMEENGSIVDAPAGE